MATCTSRISHLHWSNSDTNRSDDDSFVSSRLPSRESAISLVPVLCSLLSAAIARLRSLSPQLLSLSSPMLPIGRRSKANHRLLQPWLILSYQFAEFCSLGSIDMYPWMTLYVSQWIGKILGCFWVSFVAYSFNDRNLDFVCKLVHCTCRRSVRCRRVGLRRWLFVN